MTLNLFDLINFYGLTMFNCIVYYLGLILLVIGIRKKNMRKKFPKKDWKNKIVLAKKWGKNTSSWWNELKATFTLRRHGIWNLVSWHLEDFGMGLHRNLGTWGLGGLWNGDFRRHLHSGGMGLGDLVTLDTWRTLIWNGTSLGLGDLGTWTLDTPAEWKSGIWLIFHDSRVKFLDFLVCYWFSNRILRF